MKLIIQITIPWEPIYLVLWHLNIVFRYILPYLLFLGQLQRLSERLVYLFRRSLYRSSEELNVTSENNIRYLKKKKLIKHPLINQNLK